MACRRKPFAVLVAALLLIAQWGAVQHALSHLNPDSFAPAGHHLPCGQCAAGASLLGGMVSGAPVAAVLVATVEALPPLMAYALVAGPVLHAYRSRAPPA